MTSYFRSNGPCHRCGRAGHLARDCNLQTCFRCNGRGHMAWECADGVTCSKCGEKGHLQRNCRNVACHKCKRKGHISKFCTDPFAKAADIEKMERQQAVQAATTARAKILQTLGGIIRPELEENFIRALVATGPWGSLGKGSCEGDEVCTDSLTGTKIGVDSSKGRWAGFGETISSKGNDLKEGSSLQVSRPNETSATAVLETWGGNGMMKSDGQQSVLVGRLKVVKTKRKPGQTEEQSSRLQSKKTKEESVVHEVPWLGLAGYESEDEEVEDETDNEKEKEEEEEEEEEKEEEGGEQALPKNKQPINNCRVVSRECSPFENRGETCIETFMTEVNEPNFGDRLNSNKEGKVVKEDKVIKDIIKQFGVEVTDPFLNTDVTHVEGDRGDGCWSLEEVSTTKGSKVSDIIIPKSTREQVNEGRRIGEVRKLDKKVKSDQSKSESSVTKNKANRCESLKKINKRSKIESTVS